MRHRIKTVGQLKKLLESIDDNTILLVPGSDHSYLKAEADITTAGYSKKYEMYFEWYGQKNANPEEIPVPVVVFGSF